MIVETLDGQMEMLTDYSGVSIKRKVNSEYTLQFTVIKTERNAHSYPLVQEDSILSVKGEKFVIKTLDDSPYSKSGVALNLFFECIGDYVEELWPDGLYNINEALQLAFSTSDWTYVLGDVYTQRAKLEEFGNDNAISMLNKILSAFSSEYEIDTINKRIIVKRRLGVDTDYQIRYKYNLQAISRITNSNDVKTEVKVFYNLDEFGNYNSSVVYRSPNFNKYPKPKVMNPIYSDVITTESQAIATARLLLNDTPDVELSAEFLALQQAGYDGTEIQLGNGVYLIDERMDIKLSARIMEIETFPYDNRSPVATISSYKKMITNTMVNQTQHQVSIERTAVKQQTIYNGCTISKEDGFKATAENGVVAFLNASEGIAILRDGVYKFYVNPDGELILDGRLYITHDGKPMLESYMDENGGILRIHDREGYLNLEIGSNSTFSEDTGGAVKIFIDGPEEHRNERVKLYVNRQDGTGEFRLSDGKGDYPSKVGMSADISSSLMFWLLDADGEFQTTLGTQRGYIGGSLIITKALLDVFETEIKEYIDREIRDLKEYVDDEIDWLWSSMPSGD